MRAEALRVYRMAVFRRVKNLVHASLRDQAATKQTSGQPKKDSKALPYRQVFPVDSQLIVPEEIHPKDFWRCNGRSFRAQFCPDLLLLLREDLNQVITNDGMASAASKNMIQELFGDHVIKPLYQDNPYTGPKAQDMWCSDGFARFLWVVGAIVSVIAIFGVLITMAAVFLSPSSLFAIVP